MMKEIKIPSKERLKRDGWTPEQITSYFKSKRTETSDRERLPQHFVQFSKMQNQCRHKHCRKEGSITTLYCAFDSNTQQNLQCRLQNCRAIQAQNSKTF